MGRSTLIIDISPTAPAATVTVGDGDNLWDLSVARHDDVGIAADSTGDRADVTEVVAANGEQVKDPDLIYTGQELVLPPIAVSTPSLHPRPRGRRTLRRCC